MNCFCLTLLLQECVAEGFADLCTKRSPPHGPWTSLKQARRYLCPASLCPSSPSAPQYQMCLKGHYNKKASGSTVGSGHQTYYKQSTNKSETKYRLLSHQPSSHRYFHPRSGACRFPAAFVNIFEENIVWSTAARFIYITRLRTLGVFLRKQFSELL